MTWGQFVCLKWQFTGHLAMANEHYTTRTAKAYGHTFRVCFHVPTDEYKLEHKYARGYERYMVDGVVYKSKKKLLEAIKDIQI